MSWHLPNLRFSWRRYRALVAKEMIQMRRDRITFAMMLGVPLMQLLLFGYAINTDPQRLPTALLAGTGAETRALVTRLEQTGYFRLSPVASRAEAERQMAAGEVAFIVTIPPAIEEQIPRRIAAPVLIEADATDPSASAGAIAALSGLATAPAGGVQIVTQRRYNPEGITQWNIVPGLLGVILQMTMVMMTAMALTREVERGTMENLLAMPASGLEIMLGKITPFVGVAAVQSALILIAARLLFEVPMTGPAPLLAGGIALYVVVLLLLGYAFSTFARTQMQAMQLTFFFFLPSILLSGFMFPFRGMPGWAQMIGEALPLTHFLRLIRAVMLKGASPADVAGPLAALVAFALIFAGLALTRFRRTLD